VAGGGGGPLLPHDLRICHTQLPIMACALEQGASSQQHNSAELDACDVGCSKALSKGERAQG